jgi:MYXO-CTERM domain-containing protein
MKIYSKRLEAHFSVCAVVAAAAAAGGADAGLVYSGIRNIVAPATNAGVYINLLTGANGTAPAAAPGWHINPWGTTTLRMGTNTPTPDTYFLGLTPATSTSQGGRLIALAVGSTIASTFSSPSSMSAGYGWSYNDASTGAASSGTSATQFKLNSDNYFGVLSFQSATEYFVGWVRINVGASLTSRTIVDWVLSTGTTSAPPETITVGTIPAPGAIALLGVAGLVGARRRR